LCRPRAVAIFSPHCGRILAAETENGGLSKLPLLNPPPSSHRWVPDYACHLGGCLLACAPDLFFLAFEIACMNLPFFVFGPGSLARLSISLADDQWVPWDYLPINTFFWEFAPRHATMRKYNTHCTGRDGQ